MIIIIINYYLVDKEYTLGTTINLLIKVAAVATINPFPTNNNIIIIIIIYFYIKNI